jgi:ubiquinone biosynthesis monooxygenase Coq7
MALTSTASADTTFGRTVGQILRVNYAGEYGAIRIYRAQIAVARLLHPSVAPFLSETVVHEQRHAAQFRSLMPARATRPCGATPLWGLGGTFLGLLTGLMGTDAMMICTEAVERTVHAHLNRQLAWLGGRDTELSRVIAAIRDEEMGHHDTAHGLRAAGGRFGRALDGAVAGLTGLLIWCSTYGALTRMKTALGGEAA